MLPIVTHRFTRKADILNCEGKFIISKTPIKFASTTIIQKLGSSFHGQISRDATGNVDLVAEMQKHPDALWIRVKAIEADIPNDNGDYFSREEIIKSYKSFEGCPVFTNHENSKVENAKGKVVKAEWDDREGAVYCTMFIDRQANPPLCRAIEEGYVTDVSMGTQVDYSTCSVCEKKALTADDYCPHVKTMKGRMIDGKKVFEKNYGLKFIEISVVTDGACKECTIREVLDPEQYLTKVADAVETVNRQVLADVSNEKQVKTSLFKDGGQAEIQKLNQAMDLLEDVCRAMLDQRQFIDLEFMSKLTEVLADLQHANDELVDQGYGRMGDAGGAAAPQQMGIPPLPEKSGTGMQELAPEGPKPFLTGPTMTGVGTVTEPTNASNGGNVLFSARIKDLTDKVSKIYEEHQALTRGGNISVDKEKANQTIAKLAKIWENPSVKNFKVEVDDDSGFKLAVGSEEIVGLKGGQRVAALKIASLDEDIREKLKTDPNECYGHLLGALKSKYAGVAPGTSEGKYPPELEKEQIQNTMEAQLRDQSKKLPLHPRVDEVRESITEAQLKAKREGYEYHNRQDKPRDAITEGQLKEGEWQGYENFKVQNEPRDEIQELQLRNEKWKGNVTPAGKEGEWVAGVKDQNQQITEGQLNDWKEADKRHQPDMITEKQLADDSENWGRRIASNEDARKALTATLKAISKTAGATGATPDEILAFVKDMTSCVNNRAAAEKAVTALSKHKETRQAMLRRAKFHGTAKIASQSEIADYLLGSVADQGMCGQVGCQVLEMIASEKNAYNNIEQVILANAAADDEDEFVNASTSADYLREVLAETPKKEDIKVILDKKAINAAEGTEKYAEIAYDLASKEAAKAGIKATDKVHVANLKDGKVEVAMFGVKEEKQASTEKPVEKQAETIQTRKEARKQLVAQFGGDMGGGAGAGGPGGAPGAGAAPGGGTTMPAAAPGGDPTAGTPPVAGLGAPAVPPEGAEEASEGEALPPFTMCPVCHSENVDFRHGEWDCKDCGADGTGEIVIRVKSWPGVIEETEPKGKEEGLEGGLEEGGIGEMGGGEGMEMPPVGLAAKVRVTPEMVKIAGNKPIGSICPHCGSIKVKLAMKNGTGNGKCEICNQAWKVETSISPEKELWAEIKWDDMRVASLVSERRLAVKKAAQENKKMAAKKAELETALRKSGMVAKFARADISGKAEIIASLADKGEIAK
jgi:hypothetical protein